MKIYICNTYFNLQHQNTCVVLTEDGFGLVQVSSQSRLLCTSGYKCFWQYIENNLLFFFYHYQSFGSMLDLYSFIHASGLAPGITMVVSRFGPDWNNLSVWWVEIL